MANNSHQINFQYGEVYESHNHSNHLSIVVNLFPPAKYEGPFPHSGMLMLLVILLIILETLGNFLLLCMIFYEKYGMDSKKRTITNMLLSRMLFVQILCNIFIMPLPAIGQISGVYSEYFQCCMFQWQCNFFLQCCLKVIFKNVSQECYYLKK